MNACDDPLRRTPWTAGYLARDPVRAWLIALCTVGGFALGIERAVVSASQPTCSSAVLPGGSATSSSGRAPQANFRGIRSVYLITAPELRASGLPSGTVPSGIGWRYTSAPGIAATGRLTIYLQNTADATFAKGTSFAAAIADMTIVHDADTTLPSAAGAFDVPFANGSPFTYAGGGLYVAFEWRYPSGSLSAGAVKTNTNLSGAIETSTTTDAPPSSDTLTASSLRPETRLTSTIVNDAAVSTVVSFGTLPKPLVGPQIIQAVVTNRGTSPQTNLPVTLNISGVETLTDTQTVATLAACGGQAVVSFAPFTPSGIGGATVAVSVPADDVAQNNSATKMLNERFNLYSYKHPGSVADGGLGAPQGSTGDLVAKFTTTAAAKISAVNLEFFSASSTTYRVAIYPDSGSGAPGLAPIYEDAANRTVASAGPVTITLPVPVAVGPGSFFAGIQQTNTTAASLSYDNETPIRSGTFYVASPHPAAAWSDLAPESNFKLNIGVTLVQCQTAAECDDGNPCTDDACTNRLCTHVNNNGTSCDGDDCSNPDRCVNGACIPGPNPCDDGNACTIDHCDGQGGCSHSGVECDDANPCTDDSCIPASGCAHADNTSACTDDDPCTIGDVCGDGRCVPGSGALPAPVPFCSGTGIGILDQTPPTAAAPYPSTISVASQAPYICRVTVDLNGVAHTFPEDIDVLLEHGVGPGAIIMSDAGSSVGVSGVNLTLSDAAANPLPSPLASGTWRPTNVSGPGTESWPAPAPAPPAAPGSALSTFIGRNPNGPWRLWVVDDFAGDGGSMSGWCVNLVSVCTADADCDDHNACTNDACASGTCTHANNSGPCDDGSACTASDTCHGGVCLGDPPPGCDDGNPCTSNTCNPATGQCENPAIVCDDGNPCTNDRCDPGAGCLYTADDRNACSDNNLCTLHDVCRQGVCVGEDPVACPPATGACMTDACDPATGVCMASDGTGACDDGNACTVGDRCGPAFAENFDAMVAPSLPGTWSSEAAGAGSPWTTVSASGDSAPNSAFGVDGSSVAEESLITPPIDIVSASTRLSFRNRWSFEGTPAAYDGGVLEIDIAGGGFADIVSAGGSFVSGGYTGPLSTCCGNPLGGRPAWTGTSAGYPAYLTTIVDLPPAVAGRTVRLRWRIGTDASVGAAGQNIDSIALLDGGGNTCRGTSPLDCSDNDPCTDDSCDPVSGCRHVNNTAACDDGNACTIADTCHAGGCAGTTIACDDFNPCTDDSCDVRSGCVYMPNTSACEDGDACTVGDACNSGVCVGGTTIVAPPEIQHVVAAADKTTYGWDTVTSATRYDALRGGTDSFPAGPGGAEELCFDNLAGATLHDPAVPDPGKGFWYLARAENECGMGTYGFQGSHGVRGSPRASTTCP